MKVMIENIPRLTNQELYQAMVFYGINAGPVTPTTRLLYESKLRKAIESYERQIIERASGAAAVSSSSKDVKPNGKGNYFENQIFNNNF
jgi:hypothetical protein